MTLLLHLCFREVTFISHFDDNPPVEPLSVSARYRQHAVKRLVHRKVQGGKNEEQKSQKPWFFGRTDFGRQPDCNAVDGRNQSRMPVYWRNYAKADRQSHADPIHGNGRWRECALLCQTARLKIENPVQSLWRYTVPS